MDQKKMYTMTEYCTGIKSYILEFEKRGYYKSSNPREDLYTLIKKNSDDQMFYLSVAELIGGVTRVLNQGGDEFLFLSWIGGEKEKFSKDYFTNTMKKVWMELFT